MTAARRHHGARRGAFASIAAAAAIVMAPILLAPPAPAAEKPPGAQPVEPAARGESTRELLARLAGRGVPRETESPLRRLTRPHMTLPGPGRAFAPVADPAAARREALARRADNRAFDGAPPVMPHSRNFAATKECLECHREGMTLGERRASPMSHPHFVNCMQCHVEGRSLDLEAIAPVAPNDFAGAAPPDAGRRAWPGAPPRMPHGIAMRTNCLACHGTGGDPGLRIDHPERVSCTQCHAIAADLEMNAPFGAATPNESEAAER